MKYAYPLQARGLVRVSCGPVAGGGVIIEVSDNGAGAGAPLAASGGGAGGGLGRALMQAHAQALNAEVAFVATPQGMRVSLTLPPRARPTVAG